MPLDQIRLDFEPGALALTTVLVAEAKAAGGTPFSPLARLWAARAEAKAEAHGV